MFVCDAPSFCTLWLPYMRNIYIYMYIYIYIYIYIGCCSFCHNSLHFSEPQGLYSNSPSMEIDDDEADSCSLERRLAMREICEPTGLKRLPLDYYLHPLMYSTIPTTLVCNRFWQEYSHWVGANTSLRLCGGPHSKMSCELLRQYEDFAYYIIFPNSLQISPFSCFVDFGATVFVWMKYAAHWWGGKKSHRV